jgi:hypothetical protein
MAPTTTIGRPANQRSYRYTRPPERNPEPDLPSPPHSPQSEAAILGGFMVGTPGIEEAISRLDGEDFFDSRARVIFRAFRELHQQGKPTNDLPILIEHLRKIGKLEAAGLEFVSAIGDGIPRIQPNLKDYIQTLRDMKILRRLMRLGERAGKPNSGDVYAEAISIAEMILSREAVSIDWQKKFHTIDQLPEGEPPMLIDNFLPEGVTFFGATTGQGKTWLAGSLSKALTQGGTFLGIYKVREILPVIYLVPEMNGRSFRRRCERFGIKGQLFRCMTISDGVPCDLSDPALLAAVRELKPVIVLDTAIRFSTGEDENSASDVSQNLAKTIFALIHAGARAVIGLHHRSKDSARSEEMTVENVLRGSGDLAAIADAVWGLQYDRGDGSAAYLKESKQLLRLSVRCVKGRDFRPPEDFRIQLFPFLDEISDFAVLTEDSPDARKSEIDALDKAISAEPNIEKAKLEKLTGVGKNRQEKIAKERGWEFDRKTKWTRTRRQP